MRRAESPADDPKAAILGALTTDFALGRTIGSQRELCERFGVARSTLSDWLASWERDGRLPRRQVIGRTKVLAAIHEQVEPTLAAQLSSFFANSR